MICTRLFAVVILAASATTGWSYDSAFSLTFDQASDADGFSDTPAGNTAIVAGENTAADDPAYATKPENAAHYNGSKWLRTGADTQILGVSTMVYDGRAGGSSQTATDFVATVDLYINPQYASRHQVGLMGRADGNSAGGPMLFYARNTPGQPDGYGWRYGGLTTQWNAFTTVTETAAKWVRFKASFHGDKVQYAIDQDLDGAYDLNSPEMVTSAVSGKLALQSVINDPANNNNRLPNQFAYWDNLTYTPLARVSEWSLY